MQAWAASRAALPWALGCTSTRKGSTEFIFTQQHSLHCSLHRGELFLTEKYCNFCHKDILDSWETYFLCLREIASDKPPDLLLGFLFRGAFPRHHGSPCYSTKASGTGCSSLIGNWTSLLFHCYFITIWHCVKKPVDCRSVIQADDVEVHWSLLTEGKGIKFSQKCTLSTSPLCR